MKLIHILDNLERGGAQTVLRSLVAGLHRRGYDQQVLVLNERYTPQVVDFIQDAGAPVTIIGRPRLYALVGFLQLVVRLRREKPDLVHTMLPWGDLIGRWAARRAGISNIVSTVTTRYTDKFRWQFWLDRQTIGWAKKVVFVSKEIVPFSMTHEGVRPEQVCVIPNGVDLEAGPSVQRSRGSVTLPEREECSPACSQAERLRAQHGLGARTILGMAARLHPQKAQGDLLNAFKVVTQKFPDTALWLIGDGPERARLEALAKALGLDGRVLFAGDRDDVRDWVAAMDLFVHPSYFEGLPLSILEAMAAGKPVIATAVDGVQGLIGSGVHGWLVPAGDSLALAEAILHALEHPEERARVGQAAAQRVRDEFSSERMVRMYDELFRAALL